MDQSLGAEKKAEQSAANEAIICHEMEQTSEEERERLVRSSIGGQFSLFRTTALVTPSLVLRFLVQNAELRVAVCANDLEAASKFLQLGASPNMNTVRSIHAVQIVELSLTQRSLLCPKNAGSLRWQQSSNAMILASAFGHIEILNLLIGSGGDLMASDEDVRLRTCSPRIAAVARAIKF
jgi:hypothetical protein